MKNTLDRFLYRLENHRELLEDQTWIIEGEDIEIVCNIMQIIASHLNQAMKGNPATKEDLEYIHRDLVKQQEQENFKRDVKELVEFIDSLNIPWASEFEAKVDNVRRHLQ